MALRSRNRDKPDGYGIGGRVHAEQSGMGNGAQYYERWSHIFRYRPAGLCKRVVRKWEKPAGGEGTAASGPAVDEGIPGKLSAVIKELLHDAAAGGRPGPGGTAPATSAC